MLIELIAYVLVIGINLVVGARVLWIGKRNGTVPEKLLGAAFVFDGIEWLLWVLAIYTPAAGTDLGVAFVFLCRVFISGKNICLLAFTYTVFRPQSLTARNAVWVFSIIQVLGLVVGAALGDWQGQQSDRIWLWLETGAQQIVRPWAFVESLVFYTRMRRRQAVGVADPVVTNRFLLWAGYGLTSSITAFFWFFASLVVADGSGYPFIFDAIMIGLTVLSCICIALAFFPPQSYKNWIAERAAVVATQRGG
jgi:hypothetical protein